jgi:hypothetical protein
MSPTATNIKAWGVGRTGVPAGASPRGVAKAGTLGKRKPNSVAEGDKLREILLPYRESI